MARSSSYSPDGEIIGRVSGRRVALPCSRLVAWICATMFITTAREGASEDEMAHHPNAGRIFAIELPIARQSRCIATK